MKKILIVLFLLSLYSLTCFAGFQGDSLGNKKDEFEQLQEDVANLSTGIYPFYLTDETPSSAGYWLMQTTIPAGAESTITADMNATTVIIATFTTESPSNFTSLRAGFYNMFFYAKKSTVNRDVRIRFEVYKCTGTSEMFLFSSEQSNLITTDKASYIVKVSTQEITGNGTCFNYLGVRVVADVIGAAASPTLTFYMEGSNASFFSMPVLISDVGVTQIIEGTDIDITYTGSTSGTGDVTINSDALSKSTGTIIDSNLDETTQLKIDTGTIVNTLLPLYLPLLGGIMGGDIDFQDTYDINNLSSLNMNLGSGQHWGSDGTIDLFGGGDLVGIANYLEFVSGFRITPQLLTDIRIGTETLNATKLNLAGGTMSGDIDMDDNAIANVTEVEVSTIIARDGGGVCIRNDAGTGGLMVNDDGTSSAKGSIDGEGHDSTGWDNVGAQSFTCEGDGTSFTSTNAFNTGGAGGNKNREYHWRAGQFTLPTEAFAPVYLDEYDIAGTSYPCTVLRFSSSTDNNAFTHKKWTPEYNNGNITVYLDYFTTVADSGQIEWNVDVSTTTNRRATAGAWTNKAFGDFPGSTVAYDIMTATLTITANLPVDDKQYWIRLWEDVSDSTIIQIVNLVEMRIDYDVD